jgi:hypothetical protein
MWEKFPAYYISTINKAVANFDEKVALNMIMEDLLMIVSKHKWNHLNLQNIVIYIIFIIFKLF